ncbi:glycosyltransferase [Brumicola pallidula]|jgi:glycosyltransferase involved in cell wall biosynthesis|uniref:Phosphatidylinositol glycan, class A n=1 Tax=Brumicola pallidula DSM 14239 = ACAM 615 TaxID=1121922 RepID=K6Z0R2_9ALTE|nr:glycosyltransferase [Glaciecola pallidula]GAC29776.1 phosphatidylinositol glycan, class A [Glaciecola pallidula DSM 14239 = ACAM 615]
MINVAIVHSVAKIGGAERVSQMLLSNINPECFKFYLVCPKDGPLKEWANENNISFSMLPLTQPSISNPLVTIKQAIKWKNWLQKNSIHIVHTADPYCTRAISIAAKLAGVKLLSHYHFPFSFEQLSWLLKRLPKPYVSVFCSEDLKQDVGRHLAKITPKMRLETIHNGVDVERFMPTQRLKRDSIDIGIVANLQERKGHDDFLDMAYILSKKHKDLHFHIIGGDILEEPREVYLKAKANDLGLTGITTFHGQVPDVLSRIDALDIVVCASHQEAFPIAILEAMAMQKAIVSTDINGIPEAIEHDKTGLLVPAYSPEKLAEAIELLLGNPKKCEQLALAARENVVEQFNKFVFISKFENLYMDVYQANKYRL